MQYFIHSTSYSYALPIVLRAYEILSTLIIEIDKQMQRIAKYTILISSSVQHTDNRALAEWTLTEATSTGPPHPTGTAHLTAWSKYGSYSSRESPTQIWLDDDSHKLKFLDIHYNFLISMALEIWMMKVKKE